LAKIMAIQKTNKNQRKKGEKMSKRYIKKSMLFLVMLVAIFQLSFSVSAQGTNMVEEPALVVEQQQPAESESIGIAPQDLEEELQPVMATAGCYSYSSLTALSTAQGWGTGTVTGVNGSFANGYTYTTNYNTNYYGVYVYTSSGSFVNYYTVGSIW